MSSISGLNAYNNSLYLYGQNTVSTEQQNSTSTLASETRRHQSTSSVINLLTQQTGSAGSLTEQLSSLVRLTRYAMDSMGLSSDSRVTFSQLKKYCEQVQDRFSSAVEEGLSSLVVNPEMVSFTLGSDGKLAAHSTSSLQQSLAQLALDSDASLATTVRSGLNRAGVDLTQPFTFSLGADGKITCRGDSESYQDALDAASVGFPTVAARILSERVDPKIDFSLKTEDEVVRVNCSDSRYGDVLQAFFDENPSIVADFKRTEALAGIEDVRKFMRLSPSDMRSRIQLESMAAWWDTSGNAASTSSFGTYNSGVFSRLNGINMSV